MFPGRLISLCLAWALLVAPALAPRAARAQEPDYRARAERLAGLRAELERLESDLQGERDALRSELHLLAAQEEELHLLAQRERIRLQDLRAARDRQRARDEERRARVRHLVAPVSQAIRTLDQLIARSLPFQRDERRAALADLGRELERDALPPESALARLWQLVEDEIELTGQSAIHQQVIAREGGRELVDVAHVGMLALFVQGRDGALSRSVQTPDGYRLEPVETEEGQRAIRALFDALHKQVRQGRFDLPLALRFDEGAP